MTMDKRLILVNGLKTQIGGGRSILLNYLKLFQNDKSRDVYYVITPDERCFDEYNSVNIRIIRLSKLYSVNLLFPLLYYYKLPRIIKEYKIKVVFNLCDIVIPTKTPQIYLFDWPYAVYPESIVWNKMDYIDRINRKIKLLLFKKYIPYAKVILAQSSTMKTRLMRIYNLSNVAIIPNAVSLQNINDKLENNYYLPKDKIKLLYLTYYYSHKNLEILIPLALEIKEKCLPYYLVTTINPNQHIKAKKFVEDIKKYKLNDVICNLGTIETEKVPSLYRQCDAVLMPTLLESFSGVYAEAMYHKLTILTSNLDFAVDVCSKSAFYFEPMDKNSILNSIKLAFSNEEERKRKIDFGTEILKNSASWNDVFVSFKELLNKYLN